MKYAKAPGLAARRALCGQTRGRSHKPRRKPSQNEKAIFRPNRGGCRGRSECGARRRWPGSTRHLFLTHLYEKGEISRSIDSTILSGDSHIFQTVPGHFPSFFDCVVDRM